MKRKLADVDLDGEHDKDVASDDSSDFPDSGDGNDSDARSSDVDISAALTGKHTRADAGLDDEDDLEALIHDSISKRNKKTGTLLLKKTAGSTKNAETGGGSFQSMGLHPSLLRSLTLQGYRTPTPIQRLAIPALLANPPQDLVAMARTGSGKTLAYMLPLVHRLSGRHVTAFGARALVLLPARELALQILRVGKDLVRGWHADDAHHAGDAPDAPSGSRGESLRWGLVVGGESLDEQFDMIASNPDVIIATPGRLLHLVVEMNLDLKSVQYVVFDEADRLFELGFATALTELLARLPQTRQTLLFSATLPRSLVDFAAAGLREPRLVRLDADSKISADLRMAFFAVKHDEKDACLLALLRDVIGVPFGEPEAPAEPDDTSASRKGKAKGKGKNRESSNTHSAGPTQVLIFAATKHHVEYLSTLLTTAGYSTASIYGSLDQSARLLSLSRFRTGHARLLVVTDVAARGLDIPLLAHVVNYDFPAGARVFVHRVGRTARAGRRGWAWSFVANAEVPYLCDLQLFLGRPLVCDAPRSASAKKSFEGDNLDEVATPDDESTYTTSLVLGSFPRSTIDSDIESIRALSDARADLTTLRQVMRRAQAMYERSRGKAAQASYRRAKAMKDEPRWAGVWSGAWEHPVLGMRARELWAATSPGAGASGAASEKEKGKMTNVNTSAADEEARRKLLEAVSAFRPNETVFELGARGKANAATSALMKERRRALQKAVVRAKLAGPSHAEVELGDEQNEEELPQREDEGVEMADEDVIAAVFNSSGKKRGAETFRDEEFYMSHYQKDAMTEKGYSLQDGASSFASQARNATFDLTGDAGAPDRQRHNATKNTMTWDKKKKKFIRGDGTGADNLKIVRTENGTRLPASYRSGRFDEWKAKNRLAVPRVGEAEQVVRRSGGIGVGAGGKKYRHNKVVVAKPLDKFSKDYERKVRQVKKKEKEEGAGMEDAGAGAGRGRAAAGENGRRGRKATLGRRSGGKSLGKVKSELKTVDQIRKGRKIMEHKRAKNARHSGKKTKR